MRIIPDRSSRNQASTNGLCSSVRRSTSVHIWIFWMVRSPNPVHLNNHGLSSESVHDVNGPSIRSSTYDNKFLFNVVQIRSWGRSLNFCPLSTWTARRADRPRIAVSVRGGLLKITKTCDTFIVYGSSIDDDVSDDCTNPITRFFLVFFYEILSFLTFEIICLSHFHLIFYNLMFY